MLQSSIAASVRRSSIPCRALAKPHDVDVDRRPGGNVLAVRDAVGDDADMLIEVHRRLAPMHPFLPSCIDGHSAS